MAFRVFISYSTHDIRLVDHLLTILNTPGVHAFAAEYSVLPGGYLSPEIIQAIKDCDLFLLLWSQNAKDSEWVPQEIGIAVSDSKHIVPVVLEPHLSVPGFIQDRKYLPAYRSPSWAMQWIQQHVFAQADQKRQQQINAFTGLAVGGALLWLVAQSGTGDEDEEDSIED